MEQERSQAASGLGEAGFSRAALGQVGFGRPWFAVTVAFALHVFDEATTGFLNIYNPTVLALRARWGWFPMPTFEFREWLTGLIIGVLLCFALTPFAASGARWLRPLAWLYALIHFWNGIGHTVVTIVGHTVGSIPVARPAPGFYSSPFLFIGSVWLMVRLWKTSGWNARRMAVASAALLPSGAAKRQNPKTEDQAWD